MSLIKKKSRFFLLFFLSIDFTQNRYSFHSCLGIISEKKMAVIHTFKINEKILTSNEKSFVFIYLTMLVDITTNKVINTETRIILKYLFFFSFIYILELKKRCY
jgi:hypothetical protein